MFCVIVQLCIYNPGQQNPLILGSHSSFLGWIWPIWTSWQGGEVWQFVCSSHCMLHIGGRSLSTTLPAASLDHLRMLCDVVHMREFVDMLTAPLRHALCDGDDDSGRGSCLPGHRGSHTWAAPSAAHTRYPRGGGAVPAYNQPLANPLGPPINTWLHEDHHMIPCMAGWTANTCIWLHVSIQSNSDKINQPDMQVILGSSYTTITIVDLIPFKPQPKTNTYLLLFDTSVFKAPTFPAQL